MSEFKYRGRRIIALLVFVLVPLMLIACSGSDDAQGTADAPQVDPRYATAEALVEHFNSISTAQPLDDVALLDLIYAENDLQQRIVNLARMSLPINQLGNAMRDRFKAPVDPTSPKAFVSLPNQPAKIVEQSGQRAVAEYTDWDGSKEKLQLVKIGERWWISGYTAEHHPSYENIDLKQLTVAEIGVKAMAAVAPEFAARVRNGEFKSAAEARQALMPAMQQYVADHRSEFQQYEAYVREHPELFGQR